jgi:plastocyanin
MRLSLFWLLSVLILAGTTLPAAAQNPDALKIVTVEETGFSPADVSLKKGDFVRWEWTAGSHTIVVSENPAGSEEPSVLLTFGISEASKTQQLQFNETNVYYYYDPQDQRFSGTITVLEATPVRRSTWGFIKSVFENP